MKKRWLAAVALLLSLLLIIGGCGPQDQAGQDQASGVWDNSKWDSATWQ
ncbi:MAG: hypothetical protein ACOYW9_00985 [Deinococcota bacterium]